MSAALEADGMSRHARKSLAKGKRPKAKLGLAHGREARRFLRTPPADTLKGKRDRAILAVLLGCGLRRRELAYLEFTHLQQREEHRAIVDLIGKGSHILTAHA